MNSTLHIRQIILSLSLIPTLLLLMLLTSCASETIPDTQSAPLTIRGDVRESVTIYNQEPVSGIDALPGDKDFHGTPLSEFIQDAKISGTPTDVYILAKDGFAVRVSYDETDRINIVYTEENGWSVVAPDMPISAAAKDVAEIVVVSENSEVGLSVTDKDGKTSILGMGGILIAPTRTTLHSEGISEVESGGTVHASEVFTTEKSVRLSDVYEPYKGEPFAIETKDGGKYLTDGNGVFVLNEETIDFRDINGETYENVAGIILR